MKHFQLLSDDGLLRLLQNGAVGVAPTDTIYGLIAVAASEKAVARLYALKHRENKPGTVVAANIQQLVELGLKRRYLTAVERFWPGAVGVEINHQLAYLSQDTGRQAFRVTAYKPLRRLLEKTGPLLTTSANQPGEMAANTITEAQKYFGNQVDFYVDGGNLSGRTPSTLIRIVDDYVEVLRQGAVIIK